MSRYSYSERFGACRLVDPPAQPQGICRYFAILMTGGFQCRRNCLYLTNAGRRTSSGAVRLPQFVRSTWRGAGLVTK